MEYVIGFRDGDEQYVAFGTDEARLPVYEIDGHPLKPARLLKRSMTYPACFRFLEPTVTVPFTRRDDGFIERVYVPLLDRSGLRGPVRAHRR